MGVGVEIHIEITEKAAKENEKKPSKVFDGEEGGNCGSQLS